MIMMLLSRDLRLVDTSIKITKNKYHFYQLKFNIVHLKTSEIES